MGDAIADTLPTVAARGDSIDSFEDLYRRTSRRVFAYIASLLRDPSAAEEVTAEVFERAYRRRGSFRARRGSPEAWLFGIARNAALDELRRRRRRATLETELEDPWCATPSTRPKTRSAGWRSARGSPCSSPASARSSRSSSPRGSGTRRSPTCWTSRARPPARGSTGRSRS